MADESKKLVYNPQTCRELFRVIGEFYRMPGGDYIRALGEQTAALEAMVQAGGNDARQAQDTARLANMRYDQEKQAHEMLAQKYAVAVGALKLVHAGAKEPAMSARNALEAMGEIQPPSAPKPKKTSKKSVKPTPQSAEETAHAQN